MKAFKNQMTGSSISAKYAFMSLMADLSCVSMILGVISLHSSYDKQTLLIVLYNILSVCLRPFISVVADKASDKHSGVRIGVMLIAMGFILPPDFGVTLKTVLLGVGNAAFYSFASSSVLSRSGGRAYGIGMLCSGSVLGVALAQYAQAYGFFAICLLLMGAASSDKTEACPTYFEVKKRPKADPYLIPIFTALILASSFALKLMTESVSYEWNNGRKTLLLIALAAFVGRFAGGYIYDKLSYILTAVSLGGGVVLLYFFRDSRLSALAGILLINMALPIIFDSLHRFMPAHGGFCYSLITCTSYLAYVSPLIFPSLASGIGAMTALAAVLTATVLFAVDMAVKPKKRVQNSERGQLK